jgi:hypothetical protein
VEPISAAVAAFSAIKAGVAAGKEITSLAKDIGTMFDGIESAKAEHSKKRNRQILSVNEEAMETFIAKQRAQDLEEELRNLIVMTRGHSAWQELLRMRVEIKNERKAEERRLAAEKKERNEAIFWFGVLFGVIGLIAFGFVKLIQWKMEGKLG